ncbi:M23 family metallopeptidase [Alteromonas sp. CYL-A6]|uniref:M23 family metallopeptidase n=1 Tax=Alteromonas nitratireducens TaxID=3390813 RepID=UPI0034A98BC5
MMRWFLNIKLGLLLTCLIAAVSAADNELVLNGQLTQGSLVRGQVPADARVFLDEQPVLVNPQGKFVIGFERDDSLEHTLRVDFADGTSLNRALYLTKRDYNIQRIDGLEPAMVTPPESVLARIRDDSAKVARARAAVSDSDAVFTRFIWPSTGPITGVYGSQRVLNGKPKRPHFGVDIGGPTGTPVVAPVDGTVTLADDLYYSGNTVIIDHGMGVYSTFLHLDSIDVSVGDTVSQGDLIGAIGATGRATGPHLDWRINLGKMRLDPQLLVSGTPDAVSQK